MRTNVGGIELEINDIVDSKNDITNYPNPFDNITQIKYKLDKDSDVEISIYDITGNCIFKLPFYHHGKKNNRIRF